MKRVLLAAALCIPMAVPSMALATETAHDPFTQGSAEAGAAKAAVCSACHGPAGKSSNPEWPKLAGQGSRYTYQQLQSFKSGLRKNPLMSAQAAALSDQDMRDLAAYFAAQPFSPGVASEAAVASAQKIYRSGDATRELPACAACHLPNGAGVAASGYPQLSGQHATYTAKALRDFRELSKAGLPDGNLRTMATVAGKLTDAEIEALASYVNGLQ
jgi:cytochrome c553